MAVCAHTSTSAQLHTHVTLGTVSAQPHTHADTCEVHPYIYAHTRLVTHGTHGTRMPSRACRVTGTCTYTCMTCPCVCAHSCTTTRLHTHQPDMHTQHILLCVCTQACKPMGKLHTCMCGHTCMIDHTRPHICARRLCVQTHAWVFTHTGAHTHERCTCLCAHTSAQSHTVAHVDTCPCMCACNCMDVHQSTNMQEVPCMCAHTEMFGDIAAHICTKCPCVHAHACMVTHICTHHAQEHQHTCKTHLCAHPCTGVCAHAFMSTHTQMHTFAHRHMDMQKHTNQFTRAGSHGSVYAVHTDICSHGCVHVCTRTTAHTCKHILTPVHIHSPCTHMHKHAHEQL